MRWRCLAITLSESVSYRQQAQTKVNETYRSKKKMSSEIYNHRVVSLSPPLRTKREQSATFPTRSPTRSNQQVAQNKSKSQDVRFVFRGAAMAVNP
jgi:hypothetical protein